ncbi:DUF6328 family protein [Kitasatospora sp. NPDC096128]|uniref:DUF6328 family protein n=1 Tax=Kitasatospora sp. NPDC096128 TaxID=3155547 RepID=UPI0033276D81
MSAVGASGQVFLRGGQELARTGSQILFGFLLGVAFMPCFPRLDGFDRGSTWPPSSPAARHCGVVPSCWMGERRDDGPDQGSMTGEARHQIHALVDMPHEQANSGGGPAAPAAYSCSRPSSGDGVRGPDQQGRTGAAQVRVG